MLAESGVHERVFWHKGGPGGEHPGRVVSMGLAITSSPAGRGFRSAAPRSAWVPAAAGRSPPCASGSRRFTIGTGSRR